MSITEKEIRNCKHAGACKHRCTIGFKITSGELSFYRSQGIPLPNLCFQCRHAERVKIRNPLRLWDRNCAKCEKEIKTSYAPERPEIIYCEQCYNQEVA